MKEQRIKIEISHEGKITADAEEALARLAVEISRLESEVAAAPSRGPELESALRLAEVERDRVQAEVDAYWTGVQA